MAGSGDTPSGSSRRSFEGFSDSIPSRPSGAPFHPVGAAGGADGFGASFGLFCLPLKMSCLDPPRPELFFEHPFGRKQLCAQLDLIERMCGKLLDLQQLFPMGEVAVTLAVVHDAVRN